MSSEHPRFSLPPVVGSNLATITGSWSERVPADDAPASENCGFSLSSVVGSNPERLTAWQSNKVPVDDTLALLHKKFWGTTMAEEEQQWREKQQTAVTGGDTRNEDQRGGDCMDTDTDKRMDEIDGMEVETDKMEEDEGDSSDGTEEHKGMSDWAEGEDFIKNCYLLDLGIKALHPSKLWVRADYIRIYNRLEEHHNVLPDFGSPSAVITGQPGIGKSVWIYYALRRRLAERKPVIWYLSNSCYLFVEEGVYEAPPNFKPFYYKTLVWTLVDSDANREGAPPYLVDRHTQLFVIYVTSPRKERWSRLHKTTHTITLIMNPWTKEEIFRATPTLLDETAKAAISDTYDRLSPTPRVCIDHSRYSLNLAEYERDLEDAISGLTFDKMERLIDGSRRLAIDELSHKICLLSRENRKDICSPRVITPINMSVESRLARQLRTLARQDQIRTYQTLAGIPSWRKLAGSVFEGIVHDRLQEGIRLKIVPMVRLGVNSKGPQPRWHSSHIPIDSESLEKRRRQALKELFEIDFKPSETVEYTANTLSTIIKQGVLHIPKSPNQPGFDSFILLGEHLYLFQITIAMDHNINPKFIGLFKKRGGVPDIEQWRFVFVIPSNQTLTSPQSRNSGMKKIEPYSAAISVERI